MHDAILTEVVGLSQTACVRPLSSPSPAPSLADPRPYSRARNPDQQRELPRPAAARVRRPARAGGRVRPRARAAAHARRRQVWHARRLQDSRVLRAARASAPSPSSPSRAAGPPADVQPSLRAPLQALLVQDLVEIGVSETFQTGARRLWKSVSRATSTPSTCRTSRAEAPAWPFPHARSSTTARRRARRASLTSCSSRCAAAGQSARRRPRTARSRSSRCLRAGLRWRSWSVPPLLASLSSLSWSLLTCVVRRYHQQEPVLVEIIQNIARIANGGWGQCVPRLLDPSPCETRH